MHLWQSRDSLGERVLSFHHVISRDRAQVLNLVGKSLYQLRHLAGPKLVGYLVECGLECRRPVQRIWVGLTNQII